jgi:hypothetical protein
MRATIPRSQWPGVVAADEDLSGLGKGVREAACQTGTVQEPISPGLRFSAP